MDKVLHQLISPSQLLNQILSMKRKHSQKRHKSSFSFLTQQKSCTGYRLGYSGRFSIATGASQMNCGSMSVWRQELRTLGMEPYGGMAAGGKAGVMRRRCDVAGLDLWNLGADER